MQVLIVSPHFPPTNAADHQRVRMLLPYLRDQGCQAEVLAVDSTSVAAPRDVWLSTGLPADVPVHRVRALGLGWGRIPGLGSLTFRALGALLCKGDALVKTGRFNLVYFSTTQFGVHVLGPRWKRKYGVPFIMDYQDPWVSDYYLAHPEYAPPGGRLKYWLADQLHRQQEPNVLRSCAGITSVSPDYALQLRKRYGFLPHDWPVEILPFPGDERDFSRVALDGTRQTIFDPLDGFNHWVYVGRGGEDMGLALRGIFSAVQRYGKSTPGFLKNLRIYFIGTSYAGAGRGKKSIEPLAEQFGLSEVVKEYTDRIPYALSLRCLLDADALIVPGSDDPGYTASKIYPYLLARKPLLAVFHENSSVVQLLQKVRGGMVTPFRSGESSEKIAGRIHKSWFETGNFAKINALDEQAFEAHTAKVQARVVVEFFKKCLALAQKEKEA